ncbi:MAG: GNAT family N-acetyltransferase [Chlorobiaceae bacterium]|nr:GNAT family N-acetyltransferase [Chlorobiaceae bacterium]
MEPIRIAAEKDIPQCARLLALLFSQEHEFAPDKKHQEQGLGMIVGHPSAGTIFVCEKEGLIVGMVMLLSTVSTALGKKAALLEDMVVSPEYRGQGIGSRLLEHACDWAVRQGFGRITLLTDGDNEAAHRFYAAKGFARSEMVVFRKPLPMPEVPEAPPHTIGQAGCVLPAWICEECGYVYDPSEGDLEWNIRPGVPFERMPAEWCCPVCSAPRDQFRLFDSQL